MINAYVMQLLFLSLSLCICIYHVRKFMSSFVYANFDALRSGVSLVVVHEMRSSWP